MIHIDHLSLMLPAGLQHRATMISRHAAIALAEARVDQDVAVAHLGEIRAVIGLHQRDDQIGRIIADAICTRLDSQGGGADG